MTALEPEPELKSLLVAMGERLSQLERLQAAAIAAPVRRPLSAPAATIIAASIAAAVGLLTGIASGTVTGVLAGNAAGNAARTAAAAAIASAGTSANAAVAAAGRNADAAIAAAGTNAKAALDVQEKQFEASVILQSLAGRDNPAAVASLKFIARVGLIPDFQDAILKLATTDNGSAVPASPPNLQQMFSNDELHAGQPHTDHR